MSDAYNELRRLRAQQEMEERAAAVHANTASRAAAAEQVARRNRAERRRLELVDFLTRERVPPRPTYRDVKQSGYKRSFSNKKGWYEFTYSSPGDDVWVIDGVENYEESTYWILLTAGGRMFEGSPTLAEDTSDIGGRRIKGLARGPGWKIHRPHEQVAYPDDSNLITPQGFAQYCLNVINMNLKAAQW